MYKNLKTFRESLSMTQKDFAKALDLAPTTYSGYEQGVRFPPSPPIQKRLDSKDSRFHAVFSCFCEGILCPYQKYFSLKSLVFRLHATRNATRKKA